MVGANPTKDKIGCTLNNLKLAIERFKSCPIFGRLFPGITYVCVLHRTKNKQTIFAK